ncbi:MAG TPA: prolyl oligopeptidase family serine peptidase [Anaerolineaceae bacterium]|nr:prolyl oligopeptidase family serine peptidase [Anaerolineaceae bacterium]
MTKQALPHGLWPSPITPAMLAGGIRLNDVQWSPDGNYMVWSQSLDGKTSLFAKPAHDPAFNLSGELNPSGGVGYGGGDFCAGREGVAFAERNGRLYFKPYADGVARPITPAFGGCASPVITPDERFVIFVHTYENKDVLAIVPLDGSAWPRILRQGADFYMQPAVSPDGKLLAWVEWDHPNMPWDGTRLYLAALNAQAGSLSDVRLLDGDENVPVFQPIFSRDGSQLAWLSNAGELDQLKLLHLASGEVETLVQDRVMMPPAWVQGMHALAWSPDSQQIYFLENQLGQTSLRSINLNTREISEIDTTPYTHIEQPCVSAKGELALIAQSAAKPPRVLRIANGQTEVIARSQSEVLPAAFLSQPQAIAWQSSDGVTVHGLYYPPANPDFEVEGAPPVIVYIHGGPTSQVFDAFNLEADFFTSRGYAYFAVNYRGSTGYGRAYRDALRGAWGKVDLQDTIEGTQALIARGLADPARLIIKGGSAGGFTLLNALVHHPGFFKAGLCSYGVSNLFDLDTHKFEAHYNTSLVGELPAAVKKYHAWSPVFHADKIRDAIAVFQGSDDKVVPPEHSESIVRVLRANRVPHEYKLYEGEGHGFRKKGNLIDYYDTVDRFLKQHVIFSFEEEA